MGTGARGARRVAGLAGLDRAAEAAAEEAIVQAAESPAVERALIRILEGPEFEQAIARALATPAVEQALVRGLDSELFDRLWERLLASDEAQKLVERIAEAPEVRAAVAAQGVGLLEDLGRQLRLIARRLDDVLERVARAIFRRRQRIQTPAQAGLVTRGLALALDAGILSGALFVVSGLVAAVGSRVFGDTGGLSAPAVVAGSAAWVVVWTAYFLFFWSLSGQTPGMRFLGIALNANRTRRIGLRRSIRRLAGSVLAALPLGAGFIPILFSERRRGLQDLIGETEVVYVEIAPRAAPWSSPSAERSRQPRAYAQ
jgi:uncharacterized RDD family membrane protein YckC